MLTRKDKLLLYCLGRKTTPYEAAEKWEKKRGTEINMGPWYACKNQLLDEGLILKRREKGREKLIEADERKYLNDLFGEISTLDELELFVPEDLVKKYSKRIVDLGLERHSQVFQWGGSLYLPFVVLLFTRIFSGPRDDSLWPELSSLLANVGVVAAFFPLNEILNTTKSFQETLTDSERTELSMPHFDSQAGKEFAKALDPAILIQSLPADLLKGIMIGIARLQKRRQMKLDVAQP